MGHENGRTAGGVKKVLFWRKKREARQKADEGKFLVDFIVVQTWTVFQPT